jgi:acyl-CoA thioesterase-1
LILCLLWLIPVQYSLAEEKQAKKLLVLGDSLSAGFGIDIKKGWVNLMRQRLQQQGLSIEVINASISGDTSKSALHRLKTYYKTDTTDYLLIEIGGNDGLRGLPIKSFYRNLSAMVDIAKSNHSRVLLIGIKIPPNYGPIYTRSFENVFFKVSKQHSVPLVPFLLAGVAEDLDKMQVDGIHPIEDVQPEILDIVWPDVIKLLTSP